MGNAVSRVYGTLVKRPLQRYNVDHRAEKLIDKFQDPAAPPQRAPMYDTDSLLRDAVKKSEENIHKVGPDLLDRLKVVYVDSKDNNPDQPRAPENPERPLPKDVSQHFQDFVPAQMRMERHGLSRKIQRGKITLNQSVDLLGDFHQSKGAFGPEKISDKFKINKDVATNIVKYYELFNMMETKTREEEHHAPDPLTAGSDWVDATKTLEGEKHKEATQALDEARERVKRRVELDNEKRKLLEADKGS